MKLTASEHRNVPIDTTSTNPDYRSIPTRAGGRRPNTTGKSLDEPYDPAAAPRYFRVSGALA